MISQFFCGSRRMRAPLAPPRLSEPRKVAAEAHAVETSWEMVRPDASIFVDVETSPLHSGSLTPPEAPEPLEPTLAQELYRAAEAERHGLTLQEFCQILLAIAARTNYAFPPARTPGPAQQSNFFRTLRLPELALAHACALGREPAWQRFIADFKAPLLQAAIAMTGSATLGHDLVDSVYAELYGLREQGGQRRSPLASYTGRGSLLGWLRATLAQRHVDHHRRTHRETPLDTYDAPAPVQEPQTQPLPLIVAALKKTLEALHPQDRYLLTSYFLDRQTLHTIARLLQVHEATISRRLKRLTDGLRAGLLANLQAPPGSLSRRAAEEALGTDPRDLEINLRAILQTSQLTPFSVQPDVAEGRTV